MKFLDNLLQFFIKCVVGTHQRCLTEALLMSTQNICFYGEIRKITSQLSSNTP